MTASRLWYDTANYRIAAVDYKSASECLLNCIKVWWSRERNEIERVRQRESEREREGRREGRREGKEASIPTGSLTLSSLLSSDTEHSLEVPLPDHRTPHRSEHKQHQQKPLNRRLPSTSRPSSNKEASLPSVSRTSPSPPTPRCYWRPASLSSSFTFYRYDLSPLPLLSHSPLTSCSLGHVLVGEGPHRQAGAGRWHGREQWRRGHPPPNTSGTLPSPSPSPSPSLSLSSLSLPPSYVSCRHRVRRRRRVDCTWSSVSCGTPSPPSRTSSCTPSSTLTHFCCKNK